MAKTTDRPSATFEQLRTRKAPERTVAFCTDELSSEFEAAEARKSLAITAPDREQAVKELAEIRARMLADPDTSTIRVRAMGHGRWTRMVREHPPTDEQQRDAEKNGTAVPPFDAEQFWPAAVAASMVEPEATVEQVQELFEAWPVGDVSQLVAAVRDVNQDAHTVDLGN